MDSSKTTGIDELKAAGEEVQKQGKKFIGNIADLMKKSPEAQLVEIIILLMIALVVALFVFWAYNQHQCKH